MALTWAEYRKQNPEYNGVSDQALFDYLHENNYPDIPKEKLAEMVQYSPPKPAAPQEDHSNLYRGVKNSLLQMPQLAYGVEAGAGAIGENLFGEGGISTAIKNQGIEGYNRWGDKVAANSKENDSFTTAYDKAKAGDLGALVDWIGYGLGYAGGQGAQLLLTGGLGGVVAKSTAIGASKLAGGMVAKETARILEAEAGKKLSEEELAKAAAAYGADKLAKVATANVANTIGQTAMMGVQAFGMEGGEIYGDMVSQAAKDGKQLSGDDLARAFGATVAAGGLEFVGDKLGLDVMLGKSKAIGALTKASGATGVATRAAVAGIGAAGAEGATEGGQTVFEEFGKGNKDIFSESGWRNIWDSAALGAIGGAAMGGAGGALHKPAPDPKDNKLRDLEEKRRQAAMDAIAQSQTVDEAIQAAAQAVSQKPSFGLLGNIGAVFGEQPVAVGQPYQLTPNNIQEQTNGTSTDTGLPVVDSGSVASISPDGTGGVTTSLSGIDNRGNEPAGSGGIGATSAPVGSVRQSGLVSDAGNQTVTKSENVNGTKTAQTIAPEAQPKTAAPEFGINESGRVWVRGIPTEQIQAARDKHKIKGLIIGKDSAMYPKGYTVEQAKAHFMPANQADAKQTLGDTKQTLGDAKQAQPVKKVAQKLLDRIKQLGGVHMSHLDSIIGETDVRKSGFVGMFRHEGKGLDDLAEQLAAEGFPIDLNDPTDNGGVRQLAELIRNKKNVPNFAAQELENAERTKQEEKDHNDEVMAYAKEYGVDTEGKNIIAIENAVKDAISEEAGVLGRSYSEVVERARKEGVDLEWLAEIENEIIAKHEASGKLDSVVKQYYDLIDRVENRDVEATRTKPGNAGQTAHVSEDQHSAGTTQEGSTDTNESAPLLASYDQAELDRKAAEAKKQQEAEAAAEAKAKADAEVNNFTLDAQGMNANQHDMFGNSPIQEQQTTQAAPSKFANNKIFTEDKVAAARARLKKKLGTVNSGIDPELLQDGMTLAGAHIEAGARSFAAYSKAMLDDLGDAIKPYLRSLYESIRHYPGLDTEGMTSSADIDAVAKTKAELGGQAVLGVPVEASVSLNLNQIEQLKNGFTFSSRGKMKEFFGGDNYAQASAIAFRILSKYYNTDKSVNGWHLAGIDFKTEKSMEGIFARFMWLSGTNSIAYKYDSIPLSQALKLKLNESSVDLYNGAIERFADVKTVEASNTLNINKDGIDGKEIASDSVESKPTTVDDKEQEAISQKVNSDNERDAKFKLDSQYQQLMQAKDSDIAPIVNGMTDKEVQAALDRLNSAPGDNPKVRVALEGRLGRNDAQAAINSNADIPPAEKIRLASELRQGKITPEDVQAVVGQPAANTQDAGAELTYNKRNRIIRGIQWDDIKDKNEALRVKEVTKAKVFPKPDYQALIDDGMAPLAAHAVKQVYDSIASKPDTKTPTDAQLQAYIDGVNKVMNATLAWANDSESQQEFVRIAMRNAGGMLGKYSSMLDTIAVKGKTLLDRIYPDGWKAQRDEVMLLGGNRFYSKLQPGYDEAAKAVKDIKAGWPASQESWQRQGYSIITGNDLQANFYASKRNDGTPYVSVQIVKPGANGRTSRIEYTLISGAESENDANVQSFAKDRLAELKDKHIVLDKSGKLKAVSDTAEGAKEKARELVKRESNNEQISEKGTSVEAAERIGIARRMEGENISSDKLKETFGFKGINFGNWMKGETKAKVAERQAHLNHAYDSFMDLAEILGVPPQAMSLNGMLGIAFGAQGSGKALAHFVPGVNEINLTRTGGAGALAHEWGHAFDHYFGNLAGLSRKEHPYLSEYAGLTNKFDGALRPEMLDHFKAVVQAMTKTMSKPKTAEEVKAERQVTVDFYKKRVDGWLKSIHADFERATKNSHVQIGGKDVLVMDEFDRLADKVRNLSLGDGEVSASSRVSLYPVIAEMRDLYKKATRRIYSLDQANGLHLNVRALKYATEGINQEYKHVPQMTNSDYLNASIAADNGNKKDYWKTRREMFARAFDAFVVDTLAEKAAKNTYLAGIEAVAPHGEERTKINQEIAFLLAELKTKETEQGVAMFSRNLANQTSETPESIAASLRQYSNHADTRLQRGEEGKRGGVVIAKDMEDAQRLFKEKTGQELGEDALQSTRRFTDGAKSEFDFVVPDTQHYLEENDQEINLATFDGLPIRLQVGSHFGKRGLEHLYKNGEKDSLRGAEPIANDIGEGYVRDLLRVLKNANIQYSEENNKIKLRNPLANKAVVLAKVTSGSDSFWTVITTVPASPKNIGTWGDSQRVNAPQLIDLSALSTDTNTVWRTSNTSTGDTQKGLLQSERLDITNPRGESQEKNKPTVTYKKSRKIEIRKSENGAVQGFFDPKSGLTFLIANQLTPETAPAVFAHETIHATDTPEVRQQAMDLLNKRDSVTLPIKTREFLNSVHNRMENAGVAGDEREAASYIVEQAMILGRQNGYSAIDNTLFGHLTDLLGKRVADFVRNWVAKVRVALLKAGVGVKLTVDDMVAYAQAGQKQAAMGEVNNEGDVMSRSDKQAAFYSQLKRAFSNAPDKVFSTGKNAAVWLESNAGKLGVKKDEIVWSGITDWLNLQGKVSKADVLSYLDANGVQVNDVMLGEAKADIAGYNKARYALEARENRGEISREQAIEEYSQLKRKFNISEEDGRPNDSPKFATYTVPGGTDYRELLITLPEKATKEPEFTKEGEYWIAKQNGKVIGRDTNLRGLREDLGLPPGAASKHHENFRTTHFDQPNILAHLRFDTRTDAQGRKVLFLQEIQSDWGQKGKKDGFKSDADVKLVDEIAEKFNVPKDRGQWSANVLLDAGVPTAKVDAWYELTIRYGKLPTAPFVTDTKAWVSLALKKAIAHAVENGHEVIAWANGEQNAAHYDLSKQISRVEVSRPQDGSYAIYAYKNKTDTVPVMQNKLRTEAELESVLGKDLAAKIVKQAVGTKRNYSGLDLKVGGEGMKAFYDQIVPQVANDVLKKIGGGKVESIYVPTRMSRDRAEQLKRVEGFDNSDVYDKQQAFTITPELRAKVLGEGMPLFSKDRIPSIIQQVWNKLARHDAMFKFGRNTEKTIEGNVLSAMNRQEDGVAPEHKSTIQTIEVPEEMASKYDVVKAWEVISGFDDKPAYIYQNNEGKVWLNVSNFRSGKSGGASLYTGVLDYCAKNPGLKLVGDPQGVTDTAMLRRTELMLSAAIKYGRTDFMEPAMEQQNPTLYKGKYGHNDIFLEEYHPVKWTSNNSQNIDNLIESAQANIALFVPEIKNVHYNFTTGKLEIELPDSERQQTSSEIGRVDINSDLGTKYLSEAISRGFGRAKRIGIAPDMAERSPFSITSISRAGFAQSVSNAANSEGGRKELLSLVSGGLPPGLAGVHYSRAPTASKETIIGDTGRQRTPEQLAAFRNLGRAVKTPTVKERIKGLWKDAGKKLAQGLVDQFRPIRDLDSHAYTLMRLSKGASGAFEVLLNGGQLKLNDGVYDFDPTKKGGVVDRLLKPLQGEMDDFLWWVAANRAEKLSKEDRENLFTPEDIAAMKTLANGHTPFKYTIQHGQNKGKETTLRSEIYADTLKTFNEFHKNTLDMAEQSGLIDGDARKLWESEFYVPFYRVEEDEGGVRGMNIKGGVVRQQAFKHLKGGTGKLNSDLLDNTLMNWAHLLDAAAKNRAAKASLEAAGKMGVASEVSEGTKKSVWYMDKGQKRHYLVSDPLVMNAITSLEYAGMRNPLMNAMGAMKHALTIGVTASPFFKVRNLIRDSVQSIAVSGLDYNAIGNVKKGFDLTKPTSDEYFRLLAGGGTIHFGTMLEGSESKRVRSLVEAGVDESTILDNENKYKAFYRRHIEPAITAYNELGNRGEAVNRASLYDQLIKQGKSHSEASLLARDLMDFSMQGSWTAVRFLTQTVPFFNARMQGLYKLGRAASDDPKKMGVVLGACALASIALMLAYSDDDDWKKREDWDRDNYWWFKLGGEAFRIPKPFEIGAIASVAERGVELFSSSEMTGERFNQIMWQLVMQNLSMNPVPQLVKPIIDVYSNKDSFTGRPIETMGMERLQSEYRYTDNTSMTARAASTMTLGAASPVQMDHLLRGYFGWLGTFVVTAADQVARPATGQNEKASPDYWKVATGGMVANTQDASSRYVSQMYTQAKEIEEAYGTWRMLIKTGKLAEAKEFFDDNRELLAKYKNVEHVKKAESIKNEFIRMIERSNKSSDEKREMIRQINHEKDQIARLIA